VNDDKSELAALRRLVADQAAQLAAMEALRAENAQLRRQINTLIEQMALQNERLGEVTSILRRREDQLRRVPKKERPEEPDGDDDPEPPSSGSPGPLGGAAPDEPEGPKASRPRSRGGRKPIAEHLPVDPVRVPVDRCDHCGSTELLARDTETVDKYDVVREHVRCRRITRQVCRCAECHRVTTAPMPPMPWERSLVTCDFLAWLIVQKFVLLVPLDRIHRMLLSKGIDIAKSTLVLFVEKAAHLLAAIDGVHWRQLKAGPTILTDGTGIKVLIEGQDRAYDAHLDVFMRGAIVVYLFGLTKHGDELVKVLKDYSGRVVCDSESRMDALFADGTRTEGNCNAHARRKFRDAERVQPKLAKQAGHFLTLMYRLEMRAKDLGRDELLAWRQSRIRPVVTLFRRWMDRTLPKLLPSDLLAKAIRYYLNHFDALTRFVDDPDLPIDNNPCERAFQNHAKARQNWLFAGSVEGGHRYAIINGVVTSALKLGLDVEAYLAWVFERRGTHRDEFGLSAAELTPAAYKQALEERGSKAA
jgi:transposase